MRKLVLIGCALVLLLAIVTAAKLAEKPEAMTEKVDKSKEEKVEKSSFTDWLKRQYMKAKRFFGGLFGKKKKSPEEEQKRLEAERQKLEAKTQKKREELDRKEREEQARQAKEARE